ncbi:MAG: sigma-54 dependent transcriptional regulator [Bacteroidetes bacterium]|nr:sigma-54 dependent transcriptional regulator [Bacteroidota bacterium]
MNSKILIIEDDLSFGVMLQEWLTREGYETVLLSGIEKAKKEIQRQTFDLILSDLRLPDGDGILLLTWIKEQKKQLPVIIMTNYAELQNAVLAMKLGAFDYLAKPVNPSILEQKIKQAFNSREIIEKDSTVRENKSCTGIIQGSSRLAKQMYENVKMVADTQLSVLISGESGVGKEHIARMIHENSSRKNAPFIAVDCGSLLRELALSELFGHIKGSFTSAVADKKGVFEQADGGTVFLDEIGNLSYDVQIQLLRTLQERQVHPIGSTKDIKIDVRILTATNENLEQVVMNGTFRRDLYHRLNEFYITVPALRERVKDISLFANFFLEAANEELNKQVKKISPEVLQIMEQYPWPGNIRELRNVVRAAVLYAQSDEILPEDLPVLSIPSHISDLDNGISMPVTDEKALIESTLKKMKGNKVLAAKALKISRKTLYNKIHLYGIDL